MLKLIAQNKYKLIVFSIGLCLLADVLQHKGQTRVLFPKVFPGVQMKKLFPQSKSILINKDKNWKKGINTKEQIHEINASNAGLECDVYFDTATKSFDVHHDADKSIGYSLNNLLDLYQQKKLSASIWLDMKNLDNKNASLVLQTLIELRSKYKLQNKILVESDRANLLTAFSDSDFYTCYYTPMFNPYQLQDSVLGQIADSIVAVLHHSKINAVSGYYFQSSFLRYYFPNYPILTWVDGSSFSLVNYLFQKKIELDKSIFIALKP